jgi:hypothetical protein
LRGLRAACERSPTAGRLSTFARAGWEWGARGERVTALQRLLQNLQSGQITLGEPFWPGGGPLNANVWRAGKVPGTVVGS